MSRVVSINGVFVTEALAKVSIYDHGVMYGDAVFTMTRSFNGVQFQLRQHYERLMSNCRALEIGYAPTYDEFAELCAEVQRRNPHEPGDEHRLLVSVSRGPLGIYREVEGLAQGPTVVVADIPLRWATAGLGQCFDEGIAVRIPSQRAIPSRLIDARLKHRSRLSFGVANRDVGRGATGAQPVWALLMDEDGFLCEGTGANLFILKDEWLYTPKRNVLHGISRQYVMDHWRTEEADLELADLLTTSEAFFTATPFCALPITSVNGHPIGDGMPGERYQAVVDQWSRAVGVDIKAQIQGWDEQYRPVVASSPYQSAKC
jgi:branched-chain amino acid aminotransferase